MNGSDELEHASTPAPARDVTTTATMGDDAPPTHTTVQRFWLVVTAGPDMGTTYASSGQRTVIGTHPSANLVLSDETVSRFHCEIDLSGGKLGIRDLGSRNGTEVSGVVVTGALLRDHATIA